MKVAITGSSGLIGRHLKDELSRNNHEIVTVKRVNVTQEKPETLPWWDPYDGTAYVPDDLVVDAVIHLGGEPVASRRWNSDIKSKIYASRVYGTRGLVEAMTRASRLPRILISASAVGYYGNRGAELLTENSTLGTGFLSTVCRDWEEQANKALDFEIRTCLIRTGIVLAKDGGALAKAAIPFRVGLGGRLGDGKAYMPWIHIDDHIAAIMHLLSETQAQGAYNLVGPTPTTNLEFTKYLSSALSRPAVLGVPSFALELALGKEMAHETVLASQNVQPKRLLDAGFTFKYPHLDTALQSLNL